MITDETSSRALGYAALRAVGAREGAKGTFFVDGCDDPALALQVQALGLRCSVSGISWDRYAEEIERGGFSLPAESTWKAFRRGWCCARAAELRDLYTTNPFARKTTAFLHWTAGWPGPGHCNHATADKLAARLTTQFLDRYLPPLASNCLCDIRGVSVFKAKREAEPDLTLVQALEAIEEEDLWFGPPAQIHLSTRLDLELLHDLGRSLEARLGLKYERPVH